MALGSRIEWTEATWNPTTGCDQVSSGCDNCYALALAKRLKSMGAVKYQTDGDPRTSGPGFGVAIHPGSLDLPRTWRRPRLVFVNSMSDLFHAKVPVAFVQDVFQVIAETPQHTYQILTKRSVRLRRLADQLNWPPNLWMGVSVENSSQLTRVEHLREVPAKVRFLSAEPLLGPLISTEGPSLALQSIDWVITGGESGHRARPCEQHWVRDIRDLCASTGVAFFHKQWGGRMAKSGGRELDGQIHSAMPVPAVASTTNLRDLRGNGPL